MPSSSYRCVPESDNQNHEICIHERAKELGNEGRGGEWRGGRGKRGGREGGKDEEDEGEVSRGMRWGRWRFEVGEKEVNGEELAEEARRYLRNNHC